MRILPKFCRFAANCCWIKREVNLRLRDEGLADSYECSVKTDKTHAWRNKIEVGIMPRSAIDRLAAVGNKGRAMAAFKRGVRDHGRLVSGEISADELCEEFNADPP